MRRTAVLLTPLDFLVRLEQPALRFLPALHFWKERIAAEFRFQRSVTTKGSPPFIISSSRSGIAGVEAPGFRRGVLVGLAAGGVMLAASHGAFILHPTAE
jgi:hypothetical protein